MLSAINRRLLVDKFNTGDAVAVDVGRLGLLESLHIVSWGMGVAAGVVEIEGASEADYTGTWAPLGTVTFVAPTVPGPKEDYIRAQGGWKALRHRISQIVEGGTLTTRVVGSV